MDFITPGKTDYDKLFNNYWCPLLGSLPSTGSMDSNSNESRSEDIIHKARDLWGIKPYRRYEPTDQRIESTDEEPKELHQYPQWKLDSAQTIACTYPQVKQNINAEEYNWDLTLDSDSVETVNIVRKLVEPHLNDQIKDHHILAILAIEEAWDVLRKVLRANEKEDSPDIMNQVQVAGNLQNQAKVMYEGEKYKLLKQETTNVTNNMWKVMARPECVNNQSNKTEIIPIETTLSYNKTTGKFRFGNLESMAISATPRARVRSFAEKLMGCWKKRKPCSLEEFGIDPAKNTPNYVHEKTSDIRIALERIKVNMPQCAEGAYSFPSEPEHFDIVS